MNTKWFEDHKTMLLFITLVNYAFFGNKTKGQEVT